MKRTVLLVVVCGLLSMLVVVPNATAIKRKPLEQPTPQNPPRDERLWQRALAIHRRAIVIDTHNDITTGMTNYDFDLAGEPPFPYKTNIQRMKQGGVTGEFFSLYIRPWYVANGGSARRTLDMIDAVYRAV